VAWKAADRACVTRSNVIDLLVAKVTAKHVIAEQLEMSAKRRLCPSGIALVTAESYFDRGPA